MCILTGRSPFALILGTTSLWIRITFNLFFLPLEEKHLFLKTDCAVLSGRPNGGFQYPAHDDVEFQCSPQKSMIRCRIF